MGIQRVDIETVKLKKFTHQYINSKFGVTDRDQVFLSFRPLTPEEYEKFEQQFQDCVVTVKKATDKGGYRDRANNPLSETRQKYNTSLFKDITLARIKACLIDWKGFLDENNNPILFSWSEFRIFANQRRDLLEFANECVQLTYDEAYNPTESIETIQGEEKNSAYGVNTP